MNGSALFVSTLNEIDGLRRQFRQIPIEVFDEVYALDGGSRDGTCEFFKQHGIIVISDVRKGEIFNVGAMTTQCEYLVFFAPDGNENPDDILPLLQTLKKDYDMVIGSRFLHGGKNEEDDRHFKWRKWASLIFTKLVALRWGGGITDPINGYRAVRRSKIFELNLDPSGFDIEFQMTIRAIKLGHRVVEMPTIEGQRLGGNSTAYSIPTGLVLLARLLKESFSGKPARASGTLRRA